MFHVPSFMFIIIGLGNPGKEYQKTPHNLGFMALDAIAKENQFPGFRLSKKFKAEISEGEISGQKTLLAKPQTFMNESGDTVKRIFNFQFSIFNQFSMTKFSNNLIIIHDDIDLPLGEIKICKNRGSAGHKGVESIIKALKTKDFARVRVGINVNSNLKSQISKFRIAPKPRQLSGLRQLNIKESVETVVLQNFNKQELKIVEAAAKKASEAAKTIIADGLEKAMNKYN